MAEKLSVTIELLGGKAVEDELAAIGQTGTKAFSDIQKAADKVGGFGKLDPIALAQQLGQMGISGEKEIERIQKAVQKAGQLQTLANAVKGVESAFSNLGNVATDSFEQVGVAIGRVASRMTRALGPLGVFFRGLGAAGLAIAVPAGAIFGLIRFTGAAEETAKALTELQKVSGVSFQRLSELQQVFSFGGTAANKFASEFANLSEKIAGAAQQKKIRESDQDWVQWANDIDNVRGQFNRLAAGMNVTFSPLTTLETKVQALLESLSKVRGSEAQWFRLADIFKSLSSDLERAQLGKALGLSPETIATLSVGSAKLKEIETLVQTFGLALTASNQQALKDVSTAWAKFTTILSAAFQKIAASVAPNFVQLVNLFNEALAQIVKDFQTLPIEQAVANISTRLAPAFAAAFEILKPTLQKIGDELIVIAGDIGLAMGKALILGIIPGILQGKGPIVDAIKQLFKLGTAGLGPSGGEQIGGAASGGLIGGRGTGTSDSNLVWVSRGEHIMPARAVQQPGVLAFLEVLRKSGGNLSRVLNGMERFALGGLVPRSIPAFAGGGLVGGMSSVTIQFPGLPAIGGLRASAEVVGELQRAAALAQVRSGGRKPSRYS